MGLDAHRCFHAPTRRDAHSAAMEGSLAGHDAWICPVTAIPAITHRRTAAPPHRRGGVSVEVDGAADLLLHGIGPRVCA